MEQTFDTDDLRVTDLTAAELMALRQHLTQRMIGKVLDWMRALEDMAAPETAQEITRQCRAASALMTLLNKLVPVQKAAAKGTDSVDNELTELVAQVVAAADKIEAAPALNRHQRRKMEAKARSR